jgi:hypothetical protein
MSFSLDEQKQGSPLAQQVDLACVGVLENAPKGRRCYQTAMPADGLIAAHSMQGETSARSRSKGSLSKFKPFHTNEPV